MNKKWDKLLFLMREMTKRYFADEISHNAAALAYYSLFSFFPFIILVSSLLGYAQISAETVISYLSRFVPEDIISIINSYLSYATKARSGQVLAFGLIFTVYLPIRAVNAMMKCIHKAYRQFGGKRKIGHYIIVFLFTIYLMTCTMVMLPLLAVGENILLFVSEFFPISLESIHVWTYARFLLVGVIALFTICLLYYAALRRKVSLPYILPGAVAALISWLCGSIGFAFYVDNLANYSLLYGSIGAIIVLMIWLYFSSIVILMGAEFNHVLMVWDNVD